MSESNHQDDLDLLLSLQDRVAETPPSSPGYLSDDGMPEDVGEVDMSVFRDVVKDCVDYDHKKTAKSAKAKQAKSCKDIEVDKFSGLRIQNPLVSRVELSNYLSDIRFVRIPAIKNMLTGDTLSGCWATIGVLIEKGMRRTSSIGKPFAIWKVGCLDEKNNVSVFLFGDAYEKNAEEKIGTIFALFNCSVRKDNKGKGFSLSIFAGKHIVKLGTSPDIGLCQGKGKDSSCSTVIDKRRKKYCDYHRQSASKQYTSTRTELRGGNLKTAFRSYLKSEGIYVVKPLDDRTNLTKSTKPVKLLSVDGLKKALSTADKVTTNRHSQGIRFLNHVTGTVDPKATHKAVSLQHQQKRKTDSSLPKSRPSSEPHLKKMKTNQGEAPCKEKENKQVGVKMIELDFASSDEEL